MSTANEIGAAPLGVVRARLMVPGVFAPTVVSYLPAVLNFRGVPPAMPGAGNFWRSAEMELLTRS